MIDYTTCGKDWGTDRCKGCGFFATGRTCPGVKYNSARRQCEEYKERCRKSHLEAFGPDVPIPQSLRKGSL